LFRKTTDPVLDLMTILSSSPSKSTVTTPVGETELMNRATDAQVFGLPLVSVTTRPFAT